MESITFTKFPSIFFIIYFDAYVFLDLASQSSFKLTCVSY